MNHPFTHRPVSPADADRELLREGIAKANIPALLLVLYQMTGEERWLDEPYAPKRSPGLDDNDSGQLPENIQNEIKPRRMRLKFSIRRRVMGVICMPRKRSVRNVSSAVCGRVSISDIPRLKIDSGVNDMIHDVTDNAHQQAQ